MTAHASALTDARLAKRLMTELTTNGPLPCGRENVDGKPCPIVPFRPPVTQEVYDLADQLFGPRPCNHHAGPQDKALAQVLDRIWQDAYNAGRKEGHIAGAQASHWARAASQLQRAADQIPPTRARDEHGRQLVVIDGRYTYHWSDPHKQGDLQVGDIVLLPGNVVHNDVHTGTVTAVGSAYQGQTKGVLILERRPSS